MSVDVEFVPEGLRGLVAEGTYLWDAAKRMGLRLPAECAGRGECDTCAVRVREGATLLSDLTKAERERLSPERLAAGERLACQAKVVAAGSVVVEPVPAAKEEPAVDEHPKDLRAEFKALPIQRQLATLAELELIAATQTFRAIGDASVAVFERGVEAIVGLGRSRARRQRESHRPPEHRGGGGKDSVAK